MPIRPSIRLSALPSAIPFADAFSMARAAGFEGVELEVSAGPAPALREAADAAGVAVHSVHCEANYTCPLSSGDPAVRDKGVAAVAAALESAALLGADVLLLIPGLIDAETSHGAAWRRSQEVIRADLLPEAERRGIVIGIENIWKGFIQGPVEYARYVDDLGSPFVRAYLDVGNVVFGRPEGWIEVLGDRIVQLHLKDFHFDANFGRFAYMKIGEGGIAWSRVRAALRETGFSGWGVLAEAEQVQPAVLVKAWQLMRRAPPNPAIGLAQSWMARRVLADTMARFRRFID